LFPQNSLNLGGVVCERERSDLADDLELLKTFSVILFTALGNLEIVLSGHERNRNLKKWSRLVSVGLAKGSFGFKKET